MSNQSQQWVDGEQVEPLTVDRDTSIADYRGAIIVRPGVKVRFTGSHQGSLTLESGAAGVITGSHHGSVRLGQGATLSIESRQQGSLHIAPGSAVTIASSGTSQGSVHVDGLLINKGARGGSESGNGEIRDEPGSRVVQPVKRGDTTVYEW